MNPQDSLPAIPPTMPEMLDRLHEMWRARYRGYSKDPEPSDAEMLKTFLDDFKKHEDEPWSANRVVDVLQRAGEHPYPADEVVKRIIEERNRLRSELSNIGLVIARDAIKRGSS